MLYELMQVICQLIHCTPFVDHSLTKSDELAECAVDQILSYTLEGVLPGLSAAERQDGIDTIGAVQALLQTAPEALPDDLRKQYTNTLEALRDDLSQ